MWAALPDTLQVWAVPWEGMPGGQLWGKLTSRRGLCVYVNDPFMEAPCQGEETKSEIGGGTRGFPGQMDEDRWAYNWRS